jgi:hypothetical protein
MGTLMDSIEEMKPAYLHAMKLLSQANPPSAAQKNNLVFYGLAPEPLEVQVCLFVLEADNLLYNIILTSTSHHKNHLKSYHTVNYLMSFRP